VNGVYFGQQVKGYPMRILLFVVIFIIAITGCVRQPSDVPLLPGEPQYTCVWNGVDSLTYLDSIHCPEEFNGLAGTPIVQTISDVRSVKTLYDIATNRVFYVAASRWWLHFDFCREVLGYTGTHQAFNNEQYGDGPQRLYYLGNINYYRGANVFTLEVFPDDRISTEGIRTLFNAVRRSCYFGSNLYFFPGSTALEQKARELPELPRIGVDSLYGAQRFQALNAAEAYGYLRKIPVADIDKAEIGRHDIVVVDGLPLGMPVVAGIITTVFQTPLSHINVLSHNRGTPNMALVTAWDDSTIARLSGKLVFFKVTVDSFLLRESTAAEADSFWADREPIVPETLVCHDDTAGLFPLATLSAASLNLVGAKAANLAECAKITVRGGPMPVPEGAFAIPFYYYRRHMAANGLDDELDEFLDDPRRFTDAAFRARRLEALRDDITDAPLDDALVRAIIDTARSLGTTERLRFRSSTNIEDIEGFNGAGLYESKTAEIGNDKKSIADAVKTVYASLWTLRGFEERDYFKIDQRSCAMGILVHRGFGDEQANGVAITANIYEPYVPAYTVNVQVGEVSVVLPPPGFLSDQLLFHTMYTDWRTRPGIEYIAHSNVNYGKPVLSPGELVALAECLLRIKDVFFLRSNSIDYYTFAMDVEFKLDGPDRKLYIKQARPYEIR
jgi:hypothetical protein